MMAVLLLAPLAGQGAQAQVFIQPSPGMTPMPPPAPPPPKIEVPVVPQMDAPPVPAKPIISGKSFGDRAVKCLEDAAAAGLGPAERSAYSRVCGNQ